MWISIESKNEVFFGERISKEERFDEEVPKEKGVKWMSFEKHWNLFLEISCRR